MLKSQPMHIEVKEGWRFSFCCPCTSHSVCGMFNSVLMVRQCNYSTCLNTYSVVLKSIFSTLATTLGQVTGDQLCNQLQAAKSYTF